MRVLLLVLALSLPLVAAAQPGLPTVTPVARPFLKRAVQHFNAGEYPQALKEFWAAYNLDPQPALLYAIAQAERLKGDCRRAVRFYEAFLRTGPNERQVPSARQNIERCKAELLRSPPPASQPGPEPPIVAARPLPEPVRPPPPGPPPPAAADGPSWQRDWVGHGLLLSGLAVAATGAALWGVGHAAIDRANSSPSYEVFASRAGSATTGDKEQKAGIAGVAVGAALVAAGVVHYVLYQRARPERPTVTAAVGPGGALLLVAKRF